MKFAVTVLASILFACSVTVANPVDPSATTSAGASTSTIISTATTSTESEYRIISYEEATNLVDLSQLLESDARLIKGYLQTDRKYQEMKKAYVLTKFEELDQKKMMERLNEEHLEPADKSRQSKDDPVYKEFQNSEQKLKESEKLERLREKRLKLGHDLFDFKLESDFDRKKLAKRLFQNGPSTESLYSYTKFIVSNPSFVENIYKSLTLQLNQQSESE
ncbi:hypothetical protein BATDEDRAFT_27411 [Batrachochytrium dendrobatidis JAM81]|uniref:Uncharacterized protein n=2 Tax=Batrachochytrium dendrobatidis TaxID=109871 RepID=F4PAS0_BATDJ|nr:uncharacterized protein BATDEDRAFT_27411 [Batrachochytrium dendrobatidis JAM81]EGF77590.1 hypothetical protein BATDEDRAFT_27411 [Batrachochytrium dendrobatidis JAM81]KAJ8323424.1 hypothetical protein O5D80_007741 [Batrachochytrium dendrobatidis]KAK5666215.1 hypothetical protein QVD99_006983 [Batrachochytrium dendrobatidis]|eukprot:XP_006681672.1 hypothetical protein BATDEDRAFT_27411 [Batrachochytrium dendrobatidis JAM81]